MSLLIYYLLFIRSAEKAALRYCVLSWIAPFIYFKIPRLAKQYFVYIMNMKDTLRSAIMYSVP